MFSKNATVVLVHGAWADGSSWNRMILSLLHHGLKVICAPIPLTSLYRMTPLHSIALSREPTVQFCLLGTPTLAP